MSSYSLQSNQISAEVYTVSLNSLDSQNVNESNFELILTKNESDTSIVFDVVLPFRRLWTYTVLAYGCDEYPVMDTTYLSNKYTRSSLVPYDHAVVQLHSMYVAI